jgi:hypothetical protein
MKLKEYLKNNKIKVSVFYEKYATILADKHPNLPTPSLGGFKHYIQGSRRPSIEKIDIIRKLTHNNVKYCDFFDKKKKK